MTKQKSGAEDKSSPARGRAAKTPAAPTALVEESLAANEETASARGSDGGSRPRHGARAG